MIAKRAASVLFYLGFVLALICGGETRSLFFWPAGMALGFSGLASLLVVRRGSRFAPVYGAQLIFWAGLVYAAVRALCSPVPYLAREDLVLLLAAGIVYAWLTRAGDHPRQRMVLFYCVTGVGLLQSFIALAQKASPGWYPVDFLAPPDYGGRVAGLFGNPNHLASYLVVASLLILGVVFFGRGGAVKRLLLGGCLPLFSVAVVLTGSRGGMVAGACGVGVFVVLGGWVVWKTMREKALVLLAATVLIFGVLAAVVESALGGVKFDRWEGGAKELSSVRGEIWKTAQAQAAGAPWLGAGARSFYALENRYRSPGFDPNLGQAEFAHSEYWQALADYGWVGLGLLLVVASAHLVVGGRFLHWFLKDKFQETGMAQGNSLGLIMGTMAAMAAYLVQSGVEFLTHTPAMAVVGALLLGILAGPGLEKEAGHRGLGGFFAIPGALASACLLWFCGTASLADLNLWRGESFEGGANMATEKRREFYFQKAADFEPSNYLAWNALGESLLSQVAFLKGDAKKGELAKAISAYERGVECNPWNRQALSALSVIYLGQGRREDADLVAEKLIQAAPNDNSTWGYVAQLRLREGRFLEAELAAMKMRETTFRPIGIEDIWRLHKTIIATHLKFLQERRTSGLDPVKP